MLYRIITISLLLLLFCPTTRAKEKQLVSCTVLDIIVKDIEYESMIRRQSKHIDSVNDLTGETTRYILEEKIDTVPELKVKRKDILIFDSYAFFNKGKCSGIEVTNKMKGKGPKSTRLYSVTNVATYENHLVIGVHDWKNAIVVVYFISIRNEDIFLDKKKEMSPHE